MESDAQVDDLAIGLTAYNHALQNVLELPKHYRDQNLPSVVRNACLEAWLVNMRLFSEFFGIAGQNGQKERDVRAAEYLELEIDETVRKRLEEIWLITSKLVVHMSKQRIPSKNNFDAIALLQEMEASALSVLELSEKFEKSLEAIESEYLFLVHLANVNARTYLLMKNVKRVD